MILLILLLSFQSPTIRVSLPKAGKEFAGKVTTQRQADGKRLIINELPLETYLIGLIHGEINANWPIEVIKAQAVAARTYALYRKEQQKKMPYDLESSTLDQVYVGSKGKEDERVREAIAETEGEVLWYLGLYPAYYHSCCGGQTEPVEKVWGRGEISQGVIDSYCLRSPQAKWELSLTNSDLLELFHKQGLEGKVLKTITLEKNEHSPRNALVTLETDQTTLFVKATDFRRIIGYEKLKSTWFDVTLEPERVVFRGNGYGHGVGMCQWGAYAMAQGGADYKTILEFYYPKAVIKKLYQ